MKIKDISLLLLITLVFLFQSYTKPVIREGTNYYMDAQNGDDSNDGLSPDKAWKSLYKVHQVQFKSGDSLLFKRGAKFSGVFEISGKGKPNARIVIDAYGVGKKPCITAPDSSLYAIQIKNSDYITLQNLEVVNTGTERLSYRTGVKVLCEDYGTSHNIILNALNIHDVNGSLIKHGGGGSGILIENKWKETVSVFDSLLIENCIIRRCERNAIIWSAPWDRKNWHLSTNTIVRKNLIEEVPGDGIVPIGCDGALVEYNLMRNCTDLLDIKQAAAGIWPWSCDNTIIQYNEVSDHKAPWDGQGFDSDFNCKNTTIQYNYSHDNEGGFILICNAGSVDTTRSIGNTGTVVQYNISINDAIRTRKVHTGEYFSPTVHIGGPTKDTRFSNNILHVNDKPSSSVERCIIASEDWDGYADKTTFTENIFYATQPSMFRLTKSTNNIFSGNYYLGNFAGKPIDKIGKGKSSVYESLIKNDHDGDKPLDSLMEKIEIADGTAYVTVVNKKAIEEFFVKMSTEK
jgi:hypothetical protein